MTERGALPPKLYFRIGEVAGLVGVEPHVLRYWEREFRTIRPSKSAKGQRVYSRRDVENLLRVRELLYGQGFTIAGARRRLRDRDADADGQVLAGDARAEIEAEPETAAARPMVATSPLVEVAPQLTISSPLSPAPSEPKHLSSDVRAELETLKVEVEKLLPSDYRKIIGLDEPKSNGNGH